MVVVALTLLGDPADRRRHIVEISPEGDEQLLAIQRPLAQVEDDVLHALSSDERATLHGLLVRAAAGQLPAETCEGSDEPPCAE